MPDEPKPGVTNEENLDTSDAASGVDEGQETPESDVVVDGADTEDNSDIDFEAALFAPDPEEKSEEEGKDKPAEEGKETEKKEQGKTAEPTFTDKLSKAKFIAEKLDALPENQDANYNRLRKLNRELMQEKIDGLEAVEKISAYGEPEKIEQALKLVESLNGYDLASGRPSSRGFAEMVHAESPDKAYNLALEILGGFAAKDGTPFAEAFTRSVLGLDPTRLADFQALSRGETPEGYEQLVTASKELEAVPQELHEAYKLLTSKMREIVQEGFEQFATPAEKAEAMRILQNSNKDVLEARKQVEDTAIAETKLREKLDTKAIELENATTEAIGTRISRGLDRIVFSSDAAVNATMRSAVETRMFDLVHEAPYIRAKAEGYFTSLGVDMKAIRPQIDRHYKTIQDCLDVETVATVKGQKGYAQQYASRRTEAERNLSALALKLVAQVAKKTGAALAEAGKTDLPANLPPGSKRSTSSSNNGGSLDWKAAAAATRDGKTIAASR